MTDRDYGSPKLERVDERTLIRISRSILSQRSLVSAGGNFEMLEEKERIGFRRGAGVADKLTVIPQGSLTTKKE